jgi:hypothetical protein
VPRHLSTPRTVAQADSRNKRERDAATGGDAFTEAREREAEIRTRTSDVLGDAKAHELDELMAALRALFADDPNKLAKYYKEIADWLKLTEAELGLLPYDEAEWFKLTQGMWFSNKTRQCRASALEKEALLYWFHYAGLKGNPQLLADNATAEMLVQFAKNRGARSPAEAQALMMPEALGGYLGAYNLEYARNPLWGQAQLAGSMFDYTTGAFGSLIAGIPLSPSLNPSPGHWTYGSPEARGLARGLQRVGIGVSVGLASLEMMELWSDPQLAIHGNGYRWGETGRWAGRTGAAVIGANIGVTWAAGACIGSIALAPAAPLCGALGGFGGGVGGALFGNALLPQQDPWYYHPAYRSIPTWGH